MMQLRPVVSGSVLKLMRLAPGLPSPDGWWIATEPAGARASRRSQPFQYGVATSGTAPLRRTRVKSESSSVASSVAPDCVATESLLRLRGVPLSTLPGTRQVGLSYFQYSTIAFASLALDTQWCAVENSGEAMSAPRSGVAISCPVQM